MRIEAPVWDARLQRGDHNAFDILRLVLATFVLLEHSFFLIYGAADQDPLSRLSGGRTNLGQFAVYMFFAISGFLVTYSLQQSDGIFQFLVKRVGRIVPGFLVASAVGCLVVGPLTATDIGTYFETQNWRNIFVSAIALKQINVSGVLAENQLQMVHGTLWTIKYEFDCYILLALSGLMGLLRPKARPLFYLILAVIFALLTQIRLPEFNIGVPALVLSSPNRWPELFPFFFVGSAFFFFREHIPKSRMVFSAAAGLLVLSFLFGGVYPALLVAGVYVVIYASLSFAGEVKVFGRRVDISYGVYLYGWPVQQVLLYYAGERLSPWTLFGAAVILTYLIAWLSWTYVEGPCLRLARRRVG